MQFLIGKKVAVLDDVLKGIIVSIDNQTIGVKDSDGMVYFFSQNEGMDFKELSFNNKIAPQVATFLQNNKFDSQMEEVIQLISLPEYQLN